MTNENNNVNTNVNDSTKVATVESTNALPSNEQKIPENIQAFNKHREQFKVNKYSHKTQDVTGKQEGSTPKVEEPAKQNGNIENPPAEPFNLEVEAAKHHDYKGDDKTKNAFKSYSHAQKELTRKSQETAELKNQLLQHKALLARFDNFIKKDEKGNPIDWNFPQQADTQKREDNTNVTPPEPTEEEFVSNYPEAMKKIRAIQKWELEQKEKEIFQKLEDKQKNKTEEQKRLEIQKKIKETILSSARTAIEEYPDIANENSELRKLSIEILRTDPVLGNSPNHPKYAAELAAKRLGILSKTEIEKLNSKTNKENNNNNLTSIIGGGNSGNSSIKDDTPDNLKNWRKENEKFKVRR
jgi:hypothetical protein